MEDTEALLTTKQRDFLDGELTYSGEYAKQQRYQRRRTIIKRVRAGVLVDLPKLDRALDCGELDAADVVEDINIDDLGEALSAHVSLIYRLAREGGVDPERVIEEGRRGRAEVLYEQFQEAPESLKLGELQFLAEVGKMGTVEYQEALRQVLEPPHERGGGRVAPDEPITSHDEIDADEVDPDADLSLPESGDPPETALTEALGLDDDEDDDSEGG